MTTNRPCHYIPGTNKANEKVVQATDEGHERIEKAFMRYFHRDDNCPPPFPNDNDNSNSSSTTDTAIVVKEDHADKIILPPNTEKHEFEIIVCHANVIRYFLMRALQLPPEAWLRYCPFNCSLTYVTIRPTGTVSCRMFGDIGHIPYEKSTFSKHEGFNW